MANDVLRGRQTVTALVNKTGGAVAFGDVVILSGTDAASFISTTTAALADDVVGVVVEAAGIASNASGRIATSGEVAQVNLASSASLGDYLYTHTVAKQAQRSASKLEGAFGQVLGTGTSPRAVLFGFPIQRSTTSTLDSDMAQMSADVTVASSAWSDLVSLSLAAGTWLVTASACGMDTGFASHFVARVHDGTAVVASGNITTGAANYAGQVALTVVIVLASPATIKLQGTSTTSGTTSKFRAATPQVGTGNHATTMTAVKIA